MLARAEEHRPDIAKVRVMILSESAITRADIEASLGQTVALVGQARNAEEAAGLATVAHPQVAVLDLGATPLAHLELIRALHAQETRVVAFTTSADTSSAISAVRSGARVYFLADKDPPPILEGIIHAMSESGVLVDRRLESAIASVALRQATSRNRQDLSDLSPADLRILSLLATGLTNMEIGKRVGLSPRGVQKRNDRIFAALGARDRVEAAAIAGALGLYQPAEQPMEREEDRR
jgi:DNA-binding NarL/FixJ family response regulator